MLWKSCRNRKAKLWRPAVLKSETEQPLNKKPTSPEATLVLRNAVLAKQTWWLHQNPSRTIQGEVAGMDPQPAASSQRCCCRRTPRAPQALAFPPQPPGRIPQAPEFSPQPPGRIPCVPAFPQQPPSRILPADTAQAASWLQSSADLPFWWPRCLQPAETNQSLAKEPFLGNDPLAPGVVLVKILSICVQQYANYSIAHQMLIHWQGSWHTFLFAW